MARVLVIEDNQANLELMGYLLRAFGHEVLAATRGEDGLEMALRELVDLIICDLKLPQMDGWEVCQQLKANPALRQVPVIAITAYVMPGDRDRALAAGFDEYIAKPIVPESFVQQADEFLRSGQRGRLPQAAPQAPARRQRRASFKATLLVVDNVAVNIELVRQAMQPLGYAVIAANSVKKALTLLRRRLPDMIICDVHMPDKSGFELLRAVKADPRLRSIPFMSILLHGPAGGGPPEEPGTGSGRVPDAAPGHRGVAGPDRGAPGEEEGVLRWPSSWWWTTVRSTGSS